MNRFLLLIGALVAIPASAMAQTGYSITGGLTNFDCVNHCDHECDEFEIEIEGIHPEDVVHTYSNSNYHTPSVTLSTSGLSTLIDYHNPTHTTAVGAVEHFGISLRQLSSTNPISVRWMRNGRAATVNGQVPTVGGGTAPASQPMLPSITAEMGTGTTGGDGVSCSVTNNDPMQGIWIKRRAQLMIGSVTLEALMPNDPVVTTSVPMDAAPVYLGPGATLTVMSDLVEVEDNQSAVFAAEYYQDLGAVGPFNNTHIVGPALGNVMTATLTSPDSGCAYSSPVIAVQPHNVTANQGAEVQLQVDADGNDLPLSYQWMKGGVPLSNGNGYSGVTGNEMQINSLTSANEGFYSVRVTNTCGVTVSLSALVFITGHNNPPARPSTGACCDANTLACTFTEQAGCAPGNSWDSAYTCATNPCVPAVLGACCDPMSGACVMVDQTTCAANPWDGAGVCDPNPCPQSQIGACCSGAACTIGDISVCLGGFQGTGSTCEPQMCCWADFDNSFSLGVQDIFTYLNAWFSGDVRADVDGNGLEVQDIFDYLNLWFAGC